MRAKQTGHHDIHDPSAGPWRWCAGGPIGYRGWRCSGAGHGLSAAHGPAPSAGHFAVYLVAAHWTGSLAGILEAGPRGFACRNFVRAGNATRRLRGEFNSPPHAIPELERIVRLLPGAGGIAAVEESAAGRLCRWPSTGAGPWLRRRDLLAAALASWQSPACAEWLRECSGSAVGSFSCLSSGCCWPSASIAPKELPWLR